MVLFGCLTVVMFLIKKQVHDMTLGFVGEVCAIGSMLVYVFTPYGNNWVPYLSIIFSLVTGVVGTVCKSQLSKVRKQDFLIFTVHHGSSWIHHGYTVTHMTASLCLLVN